VVDDAEKTSKPTLKESRIGTLLQPITNIAKSLGSYYYQEDISRKELKNAQDYFAYFSNKHSEKQLDLWLKTYIPIVNQGEHLTNKKIKSEIMKGNVPMCYRGQLWAGLIGNESRINA